MCVRINILLTLRATLTLLACCKEQSTKYSSSPSSSELGSSEILASCPFRYTTKARLACNISMLYENREDCYGLGGHQEKNGSTLLCVEASTSNKTMLVSIEFSMKCTIPYIIDIMLLNYQKKYKEIFSP